MNTPVPCRRIASFPFAVGEEEMMHSTKMFSFFPVALTLACLLVPNTSLTAASNVSHSTHFVGDKGPQLPQDESGCYICHAAGHLQCQGQPLFADENFLDTIYVWDSCHSRGGAYDGLAMAKANWDTGTYESDGQTLRFGNELWCASCHDDVPAFSTSQLYEIILDDLDATYTGTWTSSSNADQYRDSVQWSYITGAAGSTAPRRPDIEYASQYSVYAWWTVHPNRATDAPYTIYYNGGSETVEVNQEINGGKWNYLGTYPFAWGIDGCVVLSNGSSETGQHVIADAVKFLIGPQGIYAPAVIGDNSTYGYYATGHGAHELVQCLDCHDANATHIDHDAHTYDAGVTPYGESYRLNEIDGQPGLDVPRSSGGGLANCQDFALCFECQPLCGYRFKRV